MAAFGYTAVPGYAGVPQAGMYAAAPAAYQQAYAAQPAATAVQPAPVPQQAAVYAPASNAPYGANFAGQTFGAQPMAQAFAQTGANVPLMQQQAMPMQQQQQQQPQSQLQQTQQQQPPQAPVQQQQTYPQQQSQQSQQFQQQVASPQCQQPQSQQPQSQQPPQPSPETQQQPQYQPQQQQQSSPQLGQAQLPVQQPQQQSQQQTQQQPQQPAQQIQQPLQLQTPLQNTQQLAPQQHAVQQPIVQQPMAQQAIPQQQFQQQQPPQQPAAGNISASGDGLSVVGCQNPTVGNIVQGSYSSFSENHARTVFRKNEQANGLDVLVYYWDDRDGPEFCGWWFGPKVGGDQVWAYSPERSMSPPGSGWRVPYDGPIDSTFFVTVFGPKSMQPEPTDLQASFASQNGQPNSFMPQPMTSMQGGMDSFGQQQLVTDQQACGQFQQQQPQQQQQQQQFQVQFDMQAYQQQQAEQFAQEAERQRQEVALQMERQRQQEAARRQQLEDLRRREQERRQREEELRRQQEAEAALRRIEDEQRRLEQHAAFLVRQACQKVRHCTPETFEMSTKELTQTLEQELSKCGAAAPQVKEEAESTFQQAQQRIEGVMEQRKKEEEQKVTAKEALAELGNLISKAEQDGEDLRKAAQPMCEEKELDAAEAYAVGKAVRDVVVGAKASCRSCTEFIVTNRGAMEKDLQSSEFKRESREQLVLLQNRLQICLRQIVTHTTKTKIVHRRIIKKTKALKKQAMQGETFTKYDKDGDGQLNKKEIIAFAKGEFGFVLSNDVVPRILKQLAKEGSSGVPREKFHLLRMAVGVAREEDASRIRKEEAEQRRRALEGQKNELLAKVSSCSEAFDDINPEVVKAEEKVHPLSVAELGSAKDVADCVEDVEEQLRAATTEIQTVRKQAARLVDGVAGELESFVSVEIRKLELRAATYEQRLEKVGAFAERGKGHLAVLERAQIEKLRTAVGKAVKDFVIKEKCSPDAFYGAVDKDGDGVVNKAEFISFVEKLDGVDSTSEALGRLFGTLDENALRRMARLYYHVKQDGVMTSERAIRDCKTVRRLDEGEVIELKEGPFEDEAGLKRVKGVAVKDGTEGWVTVVGNGGAVFLEEGGGTWNVAREMALTNEADGSAPVRELQVGEILDVYEWGISDGQSGSGASRIKVRCRADGAMGWVAPAGLDGTPFLVLA